MRIAVVGGGQAGFSLAAGLRSQGFEGELALFCAEPVPPYQRPPLSKAYLLGEMEVDRLLFRPAEFYAESGIDLRLGEPVTRIDLDSQAVETERESWAFDQLALCTGSRPRRLPAAIGGALDGVFEVRTLEDVDRMAERVSPGAHALVIGGGYIGLEAAAVASKLGLKVTVVEMAERILQRVASPETSSYFRELHRSHGVDIRESTGLVRLLGETRVEGARLADGTELQVDVAIVGIGIMPDVALAEAAGLAIENGIRVDEFGRSSHPAVWAAGDCASFPYRGERIRLESVQNAIDQAEAVAANMLGAEKPYVPKPWFWSDQYDVKLQIAGLNTGYDRVVVRPGDKEGAVSHWYYRGGDLVAVDAMNDARGYMVGKRLIEAGKSPAPETVADTNQELKALLKAG